MIEFNEFSFRYREGAEPVVRDITLSIPDGCFVGITGAAGSGKSTLTYAINGKTSPQYVWARSAYRYGGHSTFIVTSSGYVSDGSAQGGNRCAPARAI